MKKPFHPIHQDGFTLIELLIAASLSVILMLIATYGLSVIVQANQKGEAKSLSRNNLNRAIEFISDEVKTANSVTSTAPSWSLGWNLGGGLPQPKLYLEIPLNLESINESNDKIQITNHQFSKKDAVTFTGDAATLAKLSPSLLPNTVYYLIKNDKDNFQLATSPANVDSGTQIDLVSDSTSQIGINRLVIYYLRDSTGTWLKKKTINRSTGSCVTSSCDVLVDSIATKDKNISTQDGFNVQITSSRQVAINITSQLTDDNSPRPDDLEKVSAEVFARPTAAP
ncbi:prepilin-type N-terminal cleavage/methylation domain-containing protein [Merismopedia glauca]|uniref:Prepilin-type cleavage/methylation domain-containing protein n=1 Tax=Merismopedia glauca CCAP 1448/3 TaxID=1296344 RepID=A0A2T1C2U8_9CYAN|nr:prepilin-type N-terminal cleavage/methylation domain-containing protein [Merismopedia glauca]PSB02534.1 hypothetical protein C7B64_12790 [Merismopedia glauca CCAP 1448/3]